MRSDHEKIILRHIKNKLMNIFSSDIKSISEDYLSLVSALNIYYIDYPDAQTTMVIKGEGRNINIHHYNDHKRIGLIRIRDCGGTFNISDDNLISKIKQDFNNLLNVLENNEQF